MSPDGVDELRSRVRILVRGYFVSSIVENSERTAGEPTLRTQEAAAISKHRP
ncbi:MAG: hypothetical protein K0R13_3371 [Propionibacteriaceae bacterium]|nr:hypothetical protein [Propionibacteriaceae bacterium]